MGAHGKARGAHRACSVQDGHSGRNLPTRQLLASGTHPEEGRRCSPSAVVRARLLPVFISFLSVCMCYKNIFKISYVASAPILEHHSQNRTERIGLPRGLQGIPLSQLLSVLGLVYATDGKERGP